MYVILDGPLPVKEFVAAIEFKPIPHEQNKTFVVWHGKLIPSLAGNILCCGGVVMRMMQKYACSIILEGWQQHLMAQSHKVHAD